MKTSIVVLVLLLVPFPASSLSTAGAERFCRLVDEALVVVGRLRDEHGLSRHDARLFVRSALDHPPDDDRTLMLLDRIITAVYDDYTMPIDDMREKLVPTCVDRYTNE